MDARKKIVTVTVTDAPLDAALASLSQNVGTKRVADEARVQDARDALKPVVALAKAVLADVEKLRAGYQAKLFSLTDGPQLASLRARGVPERFIVNLHRAASSAALLLQSASTELGEVSQRVARLDVTDLVLSNYGPMAWRSPGLYPTGPSQIEATVRNYEHSVKTVNELLDFVIYTLAEINARLAQTNGNGVNGHTTMKIVGVDDVNDAPTRPVGPAVSDFDVLGG